MGATLLVSKEHVAGNSRGATGGTFLGSIAVTLINTGQIAISPPWEVTLVGDNYQVCNFDTSQGLPGILPQSSHMMHTVLVHGKLC